ncbi:MAG: NAD(P)/FAD-dependent oxidoreductase [Burkholderiales bacterium]|nr:NAD(P)/FAD-dependent oxidoreductase [Burkholderiales bacterium]
MMTVNCDVLVVGLGPGGGAAAATAARLGLAVVAIEKKKTVGVPVQCAEFIPLPLSRHAQSAGVLLQKISGMKSMLPSGAAVATPFSGLMVDRAAFDQALARAAQEAGATMHTDSVVTDLDARASTATMRTPLGTLHIHYRLLIAADGPHSMIAGALGLPRLATVNTRQYTVPLVSPYAATDIWLSEAYPGGYAWLFPKGASANLGLGMDPRFCADMKTSLDALHRQLVDAGRVGGEILFRTGGAIPVGGMRERLVVGNVIFAGDAAGLTHPITGAGIAAAVVSGERAGEAACALLHEGNQNALADYEEDIRDQYAESLARAVERRRELEHAWNTPAAKCDAVHRRGWIAFADYYSGGETCRDAA